MVNAKVTVLRVAINGREVDVKMRGLNLQAAADWCPKASDFKERCASFVGAPTDKKYAVLPELQEAALLLLEEYDEYFQKHSAAILASATYGMLLTCIDTLYDISDPFAHAERCTMDRIKAMEKPIELAHKLGVTVTQDTGGGASVESSQQPLP